MEKIDVLFRSSTEINTAVYFDHKVADLVSTVVNAIGYGGVPTNMGDRGEICSSKFIRFIDNCEETIPLDEGLKAEYDIATSVSDEFSEERRCPIAWYKKINYDTGVYEV